MILFKLRCAADHEFEGWFRDNAAYDRQHSRGLITCPSCGGSEVEKAPMAPRLGRNRSGESRGEPRPSDEKRAAEAPRASEAPGRNEPPATPPSPAEIRHVLQHLRRQIEANCDYVGPKFSEEARRIHRGEVKPRGIYGEATPAESQALADEGIEIAAIPWVPPNDA